jgi:hypothetical protein
MKHTKYLVAGLLALFTVSTASTAMAETEITPFSVIYLNYKFNASSYPDWYDKSSDNSWNAFDATRGFIGLKAKLADKWSSKLILDFKRENIVKTSIAYDDLDGDGALSDGDNITGVSETAQQKRLGATIRNAFIQYQAAEYFGVKFGIFDVPHAYQYKYYKYLFVAATPSTIFQAGRSSIADAGLAAYGNIALDEQTVIAKYEIGVFNGEGPLNPEVDGGKALEAALQIKALALVDTDMDVTVGLGFRTDQAYRDAIPAQNIFATTINTVNAEVYFINDFSENFGLDAGGGFVGRTTVVDAPDTDDVNSTYTWLFADFNIFTDYGVLVRADQVDPDDATDDDEYMDVIVGPYVSPIPKVKFCLNYRVRSYTGTVVDPDGEEQDKPADKFLFLNASLAF